MSIGRRRLVPVLVGLGCGALVAVAAVLVAPRAEQQAPPPPQAPSSEPVGDPGPIAVGPLPYDDASQPPAATGPLLLPIPPPAPAPPPGPPLPPGPPIAAPAPPAPPKPPVISGPAAQIVSITNARRVAAGCKPLTVDPRLNRSALRHSQAMASKSFFSHDDPSGHDFADREVAAGFPADRTGGENIARGYRTAAETMSKWMNSPPHRRNILDCEFKTIGVGYVANGHYWTQNFGF